MASKWTRSLRLLEHHANQWLEGWGAACQPALQPALLGFPQSPMQSQSPSSGIFSRELERISEWLAVPKRKTSPSRRGKRWANRWLQPKFSLAFCSCGRILYPHQVKPCCVKKMSRGDEDEEEEQQQQGEGQGQDKSALGIWQRTHGKKSQKGSLRNKRRGPMKKSHVTTATEAPATE
ncbi:hypothetical protein BSKO_08294 [Bryopsis sp. KO-2023]|nr:hypothetical protein BSKO_08294 [Bryopsis sp. KO-2023]